MQKHNAQGQSNIVIIIEMSWKVTNKTVSKSKTIFGANLDDRSDMTKFVPCKMTKKKL